jgi:hypothetical protein
MTAARRSGNPLTCCVIANALTDGRDKTKAIAVRKVTYPSLLISLSPTCNRGSC